VIQVKKNQKNLYKSIRQKTMSSKQTDRYCTIDRKRNRIEYRDVTIYNLSSEDCQSYCKWKGIKTIIHIHRYGNRASKEYSNDNYYISSLAKSKAKFYADGIRSHWSIENKLHWVKDVILNEDKNAIVTGSIATNVSILKSMMINVFRLNGFDSIKYAVESFANKPEEALLLIKQLHILKNRTV